MPIWVRRFTFNKIKQYYEEQNKNTKESVTNNKLEINKGITGPDISPSYSTKASTK